LKQARQRASRRFLKDGARSSLPQYLHTSFSAADTFRDDRGEVFAVVRSTSSLRLGSNGPLFHGCY
jgi:hypothetical protein